MSTAIQWKGQRIVFAFILFVFGLFLPFHVIRDHRKELLDVLSDENAESPGDKRCFLFEDLLKGPGVIKADDPQLIETLREKILFYPSHYSRLRESSKQPEAVSKDQKEQFGQINQTAIVDSYFSQMENGVFVEAGAWDGEYLSNTIFFEEKRNWTGLLVEPNKRAFKKLVSSKKRPRSIAANVCLSIHPYPQMMTFDSADVYGGVIGTDITPPPSLAGLRYTIDRSDRKFYPVQCFPLFSLLLASNITKVDYLSLDVEGAEFSILRTIPFDKIDIRCMSVEVEHSSRSLIQKFLMKKGFRILRRLSTDVIFVKDEKPKEDSTTLKGNTQLE